MRTLPWVSIRKVAIFKAHDALHRGEAYRWMLLKTQKWERDYINQDEGNVDRFGAIFLRIWLNELAIRRSLWCWYAKRTESMGMWNNYGAHGIAIVSSIAKVRAALSLPDDARTSVAKVNYVSGDRVQRYSQMLDPLWINRPYYFKQDAYDYEQEVRFAIACEPVQLATDGGIVRKVNASLLIDEVLISPHIHLDEAIAIKDIILKICPFLGDDQIKISSLLYAGNPATRLARWQLTKGYEHPSGTDMPDRLSNRHEEAEYEGKFRLLPKMILEVWFGNRPIVSPEGDHQMTVGIASACKHEGKTGIVLCCDWQGTLGDFIRSDSTDKMRYIDWATVLLAGELTAANELVFECDQPVRAFLSKTDAGRSDADLHEYLNGLRDAVARRKAALVKDYIRRTLGIDDRDFWQNGKQYLTTAQHDQLLREIMAIDLDTEVIIGATRADDDPAIVPYSIWRPGFMGGSVHHDRIGTINRRSVPSPIRFCRRNRPDDLFVPRVRSKGCSREKPIRGTGNIL
jgi:hypothetical protein